MDHVIEKLLYFDMMTTRVLTLFGEEELPAAPKPAAAKKKRAPSPDTGSAPETTPGPDAIPGIPDEQAKKKESRSDTPPAIINEETGSEAVIVPAILNEQVNETDSEAEAIPNEEIREPEQPVKGNFPVTGIPDLPKDEPAEPETISAKIPPKTAGKKSPAAKKPSREKKPPSKTGPSHDEQPLILSDWQSEKQYYTIGETAALFGVNISHIRFWTNQFTLKVRTTRKGDRLYTPAIIQELRTIYHLVKERGFTLNGAKTRLKEQKKGEIEAINLRQSLLNLRSHLVEIRNRIT